jgi:hypothetical protein
MLKKGLLILVGVALTVSVLGAAGFVYAQTQDPPAAEDSDKPFGFGRQGSRGGFGGFGGSDGVLHEYMLPALAAVFGFSDEQVAAFETSHETMQSVRDDYTSEEIKENMSAAFTTAIEAAVADGAITQEEADQMSARQGNFGQRGSGGRGGKNGGFGNYMQDGDGVIHDYVQDALAETLGVTVEELDDLNLRDHVAEQGLTDEEVADIMAQVFETALDTAVENGDLTQEQADRMKERMGNFDGGMPFGRGGRGRHGGAKNGN